MTVHTTYFGAVSQFDPPESADVLDVVRYPKDFVERVTDRNIPAVAPPTDLLEAYKRVEAPTEVDGASFPRDIAWKSVDFERRYRSYLRTGLFERVILRA